MVIREFGLKRPEIIGFAGRLICGAARKLKNSLFFSLLAGNLAVETGSITTASATSPSSQALWTLPVVDREQSKGQRCKGPIRLDGRTTARAMGSTATAVTADQPLIQGR